MAELTPLLLLRSLWSAVKRPVGKEREGERERERERENEWMTNKSINKEATHRNVEYSLSFVDITIE